MRREGFEAGRKGGGGDVGKERVGSWEVGRR